MRLRKPLRLLLLPESPLLRRCELLRERPPRDELEPVDRVLLLVLVATMLLSHQLLLSQVVARALLINNGLRMISQDQSVTPHTVACATARIRL
jgi:hypothetical protein